MTIDPKTQPPVTISWEVAWEREAAWLTQSLLIDALTDVVLGKRTIAGLAELANEYSDPRQSLGRAHRSQTAMERSDGLAEEARERAAYRLREIVGEARKHWKDEREPLDLDDDPSLKELWDAAQSTHLMCLTTGSALETLCHAVGCVFGEGRAQDLARIRMDVLAMPGDATAENAQAIALGRNFAAGILASTAKAIMMGEAAAAQTAAGTDTPQ